MSDGSTISVDIYCVHKVGDSSVTCDSYGVAETGDGNTISLDIHCRHKLLVRHGRDWWSCWQHHFSVPSVLCIQYGWRDQAVSVALRNTGDLWFSMCGKQTAKLSDCSMHALCVHKHYSSLKVEQFMKNSYCTEVQALKTESQNLYRSEVHLSGSIQHTVSHMPTLQHMKNVHFYKKC